jgi:quercetin dioxygenase-like cupin family protein
MTLVQLAEAADLSHSFLSQLERGLARPSMGSLGRIAFALGSSQVELLAGPGADDSLPGIAIVRAGGGQRGPYGTAEARMLVSGERRFEVLEVTGTDRSAGEPFSHDEDEFISVVRGTVRVELHPGEIHVLHAGDSLYYVGGTPHRWAAVDDDGYVLFVVKERPGFLR